MVKLAIMYDFDQTLSPRSMQEYSLLPALGAEPAAFWKEVGEYSRTHNMDSVLCYMYCLMQKAREAGKPLTREFLNSLGKDLVYYPGVEEYFERINRYAQAKGVTLQHYIISSGTQEILEGSSIYHQFTRVFACQYHYDENGEADWPATAINYTGKTQFLYRINKNSLDVYDNSKINRKSVERDIPFRNMIYIADGFTDVPCMVLVKNNGGYSIAVHEKDDETYKQLVADKRVDYVSLADWRENSQLDQIIKAIIDKIALQHQLETFSVQDNLN